MITGWLLDTSAAARSRHPLVLAEIDRLLRDRLLYTCPVLELEALGIPGSPAARRALARERADAYRAVPLDNSVGDRAIAFQLPLDRQPGQPPVPTRQLLVAATAQLHGLGVLHYDASYQLLGERCGVRQEAVVPIGMLP